MRNITRVVQPNATSADIINDICTKEHIKPNDPFAFSCIMVDNKLKINCLIPQERNPWSVTDLITTLFSKEQKDITYVNAPLEDYLTAFRPNLLKMVTKVYPLYCNLIPDREDMYSILCLKIVQLYNQDYYLHNRLIYKSFVNELNKEVRKIKHFNNTVSLDSPISTQDGDEMCLGDLIPDPRYELEQHQEEYNEYVQEMFNEIKEHMLQSMSELSFDRIMIQLKNKCVDRGTSYQLKKVRDVFNPDTRMRSDK